MIERAFSIFKRRFEILRTVPQSAFRVQVSIVNTYCILHNFLQDSGDKMWDDQLNDLVTDVTLDGKLGELRE